MSFPTEGRSGEIDDRVRLTLAGDDVRIFEDYSVHTAVLQQPAAFSTRLSAGKRLARELLERFPPGPKTPFELSIGPYKQFTGDVDAVDVVGAEGSTSVSFRGRDPVARLYDSDIEDEQTFENESYLGIVQRGLKAVGFGDRLVEVSNTANLKIRSGARVKIRKEPIKVDEVRRVKTGGGERVVVTAKLGESWYDFIHRHIEKFGLFLWADANGDFILSRPNRDQDPLYEFSRQRGQRRNVCNVRDAHFTNDTARRLASVVIFARAGGKKYGRNHVSGAYVDEEMEALGFKRRRVYRDANVSNAVEASAYAARKIGEVNRASWKLVYTLQGHSAPTIDGGRAVVIPDTVAMVNDDELGIHEPLYIESCEYKSPPRSTTVTMMRPRDIVFDAFED